jgi:protein-L-isoaspartate(D-aspartate) O-methyltransferase
MVKDQIIGRGIKDQRVIQTMESVPRHLFVEEALASTAYGDFSLPIGEGQTISKPYMVALMTEALALKPQDRVLEIGTGSGYQTAILSKLCRRVFSIERIKCLAIRSRRLLSGLGFYNVVIRICDGSQGWPEDLQFDAIIVTAGAPHVPEPVLDQLAEGGRLVIPVGTQESQKLLLLRKENQEIIETDVTSCEFVKLIGNYGWKD